MLTAAMVSLGLVGPIVDPLPLQGRLLLIAQCVPLPQDSSSICGAIR